ncbi:MAG TPA: protein kinase [Thermoanaerobaculia bacterium]|nr:protein kinase [Thermoanaerobaculia bacterium]
MPLAPGSSIGPYEVVSLLGSGGMGEVYRTHDVRLSRDVAVKIINPLRALDSDAIIRFEREARAASALNHPHILHIYDIGKSIIDGIEVPYITMELVDGVTLSRKIHIEGATLTSLLEWLAQVADALTKAHASGIIHRDLKPDNIMITRDGYAKILDFGLAKLVESAVAPGDNTPTAVKSPESDNRALGTVGYMSPEQALGERVDHRADVFSFGCILYEVIARRRAFLGDSAVDTLHKIIYSPPDTISESVQLPPELDQLLSRCLAKDPYYRIRSMKEVASILRSVSPFDEAGRERPRSGSSSSPGSGRLSRSSSTDPGRPIPTIAVLPFDDLSPDRDNDYFSDGLTEEIISDLSAIQSIRVISRASVMRFKGTQKDIRAISRELGATFILDGSVRKAGNDLRISAQLIDAATEANVWSEKYKGTLDDIFDIQEKVAFSLAEKLKVKLSDEESARIAERPIPDVHAYEAYLRARKHVTNFTSSGMADALAELDRATNILGPNVLLLSARGYIYWQYFNAGISPDPSNLDRAEEMAKQIFKLDPDSHHGHRLMGLVHSQRAEMQEAVRHLKQAIAIDPNDPDSLVWLVVMYGVVGRGEAAGPVIKRMLAIDPMSWISLITPAIAWLYSGRVAKAIEGAEKAWRFDPGIPHGSFFYAQTLIIGGRQEEAFAVIEASAAADPENVFNKLGVALKLALSGDGDTALSVLDEQVLKTARVDPQYSTFVAEIYALSGDHERALEWLAHAVERGFTPHAYLGTYDTLLQPLHGDARFDEIIARAQALSEAFEV